MRERHFYGYFTLCDRKDSADIIKVPDDFEFLKREIILGAADLTWQARKRGERGSRCHVMERAHWEGKWMASRS